MKYYLIFLLLLPFRCLSQHAVVAAVKMNVLYIGVENPVSFAVEGNKCSELTLAVTDGSAKRTNDCDYTISVSKPGKVLIFIIKDKDTLYRSTFRVKHLPDPVICPGHDRPCYFRLDSLRLQNGLPATMKHFEYDTTASIESFELTVIRDKHLNDSSKIYCAGCLKKIEQEHYEVVFFGMNKGANFNEPLKSFIQSKLMPGDKVFIEMIKVRMPDGLLRQLGSIIFRVQ